MKFGNRQFHGMIPRLPARQLPETAAAQATNCWLDKAIPRPVKALIEQSPSPSFGRNVETVWQFDDFNWFQWDSDVDVVRAPVREDVANRIMWTGDGYPKQTTANILRAWSSAGVALPAAATSPHGITVDPSNNDLLISDTTTDRFYRYDGSAWDAGTVMPPGVDLPRGITMSEREILVADVTTLKFYRYSSGSWDAGTALPTGVTSPEDITLDGDDVIIIDATTRKFYRYSNGTWDDGISVPSGATEPTGIVRDGNGFLIVDATTRRFYRWAEKVWDAGIGLPSEAVSPRGITIRNNNVLVVDVSTRKYYVYSTEYRSSMGPPISRRLGIPAPSYAPIVTLSGDAVGEAAEEESHAWVYTFVSDLDEEGPPSPPSQVLDRNIGADGSIRQVTVSTATSVTGPYSINRKRIYRTSTGSSGTSYRLVAEVLLATADYDDTRHTTDLGDSIISTTWDPPPENLEGLHALPNGVLAGFVGREIYFSEPFQPHAWPPDYIQTVDDPIVGLDNFGTNVVVGTQGKPYLISGSHPASTTMSKMELEQPCASKKSFASIDRQGVVFASHEGIVLVGPGGGEIVTTELYDRPSWKELNPSTMRCLYHDGAYIIFTDTKTIVISTDTQGVVEFTDAGIKAVWRDSGDDKVYVIDHDTQLKEWTLNPERAGSPRTMTWKSKLYASLSRTYSAAQVIAHAYPVTFKLFADGREIRGGYQTVRNSDPFRLPGDMGLHTDWEYEISGTNAVEEVHIGSMAEMLGG